MPKSEERKLFAVARSKGWSKKRQDAFVYGILRKNGWKPKRRRK